MGRLQPVYDGGGLFYRPRVSAAGSRSNRNTQARKLEFSRLAAFRRADARCRLPGDARPKLPPAGWPEQPSLRFQIRRALRRHELCDPDLCPDASDQCGGCDFRPLDRSGAAQSPESGQLIRRANELRGALKSGGFLCVRSPPVEFRSMLILDEERDTWRHEAAVYSRRRYLPVAASYICTAATTPARGIVFLDANQPGIARTG